jgi:hypothetical protein
VDEKGTSAKEAFSWEPQGRAENGDNLNERTDKFGVLF